MTKKKIYIDIGMVIGGIVLLFILKGEKWSLAKYFFFYMCSGIGSVIGFRFSRGFLKSFVFSVLISTSLLFLGLMIADLSVEGISALSGYLMWLPLIIILLPLYGLAGTLSMFPLINFMIDWTKKKNNKILC